MPKDITDPVEIFEAVSIDPASVLQVKKGSNLLRDARDDIGWTVLDHLSKADLSEEELEPLIQHAIECGADIDARDPIDSHTPIFKACMYGNPAAVKAFIKCNAEVNAVDPRGYTPLHIAVIHAENADHINALLGAGANVNAANDAGDTALHLAIMIPKNAKDFVEALLESGADINDANYAGETPISLATQHGLQHLVDLMSQWTVNAEAEHGTTAVGGDLAQGIADLKPTGDESTPDDYFGM